MQTSSCIRHETYEANKQFIAERSYSDSWCRHASGKMAPLSLTPKVLILKTHNLGLSDMRPHRKVVKRGFQLWARLAPLLEAFATGRIVQPPVKDACRATSTKQVCRDARADSEEVFKKLATR